MYYRSRRRHSPFTGIICVIIGLMFLLDNFDILSIHELFFHYWPVILIVFGLFLIIKNMLYERKQEPVVESEYVSPETSYFTDFANDFDESKVFGDIHVDLKIKNFTRGSIRTVFGQLHVNLKETRPASGESVLYLNTVFGEIHVDTTIDVPVKISASNLAGDIYIKGDKRDGVNQRLFYKSDNYEAAPARLHIICNVSFGEIHVN